MNPGRNLNPQLVVHVQWAVEWWEALSEMQDFASTYCTRRFAGELGDRARLASNELLENAVRYAVPGSEVTYEVMDTGGGFSIRVINEGMGSRIAWLKRHVDQLKSGSSIDAYRKAVRKLWETGERGNAAGLGLLRVRHEANAEIEIHVDDRRVSVTATGQASFDASQVPAGLPGRRRGS